MGDVAGVGPEIIARALCDGALRQCSRPLVVGHPQLLERAVALVGGKIRVVPTASPDAEEVDEDTVACWNPSSVDSSAVPPGANDARAGRAAFDWLAAAARAALTGQIDGVTTAPLSKAALHLAGLNYPGHTEILAEICGVEKFGMMLFLPRESPRHEQQAGLGVAHVTLHTSLRSVPNLLTTAGVYEKITLLDDFLASVGIETPRVAVCALNPHAGEEGLFGDEESTIISPAIKQAKASGLNVVGPLPADTVFQQAAAGNFDGVVAMYHDQGHIALKLLGQRRAVNVTLGLPIVRTSPSHGTAFDIAWKGIAQADGLIEAVRIAAKLVNRR